MPDPQERTFLAIFRAEPALSPDQVKVVMSALKGISNDRMGLAFSTSNGTVFGVVLKCSMPSWQLRSALEGKMMVKDRDFVMVLSLAEDWSASGNSAGWRHIQALLPQMS